MPTKDRNLRERISNHLEERRKEHQSEKTVESAEYVLNRWAEGLVDAGLELSPRKMGEKELRLVFDIFKDNRAQVAAKKKSRRKKQDIDPETSLRYQFWCLSFVKTFLKREGNREIETVRIVRPHNMTVTRDWLDTSNREERMVWDYLNERGKPIERAMIALELGAGYRRVEVMRLKANDVHATYMDVNGKGRGGGKRRSTYLSPSVKSYLMPWLDERSRMINEAQRMDPNAYIPPEVFIHNRGKGGILKAYSESGLDGIMERILDGVEEMYGRDFNFSHHTMRRTLGRMLKKKGQPIENIQNILGHESPAMTYQYLGLDLDDQKDAFDVLEEANAFNTPKKGILRVSQ